MDINNFIIYLSVTIFRPVLDNSLWKMFGYKKRPKRGRLINKIFINKDKLNAEDFLVKELTIIAFIDIINTVKENISNLTDKRLLSLKPIEFGALILTGVADSVFSTLNKIFKDTNFEQYLLEAINDYSINKKYDETFLLRAKKYCDLTKNPTFLLGAALLFNLPMKCGSGILLDKKVIAKKLLNVDIDNDLSVKSKPEIIDKYTNLFFNILSNK